MVRHGMTRADRVRPSRSFRHSLETSAWAPDYGIVFSLHLKKHAPSACEGVSFHLSTRPFSVVPGVVTRSAAFSLDSGVPGRANGAREKQWPWMMCWQQA